MMGGWVDVEQRVAPQDRPSCPRGELHPEAFVVPEGSQGQSHSSCLYVVVENRSKLKPELPGFLIETSVQRGGWRGDHRQSS